MSFLINSSWLMIVLKSSRDGVAVVYYFQKHVEDNRLELCSTDVPDHNGIV